MMPTDGALPKQAENRRVGKFRRAPKAALLRVGGLQKPLKDALQGRLIRHRALLRDRELPKRRAEGMGILFQRRSVVLPGLRDRLQDLAERGAPPARLRWEVGSAPERGAIGGEKDGERPAGGLAHRLQGRHIEMVDI